MPTSQTILALCIVAITVAVLAYKVYKSLHSSSCGGDCSCHMMPDKAKNEILEILDKAPKN